MKTQLLQTAGVALTILAVASTPPRTGSVVGRVVNYCTGRPVPYTNIVVQGTALGAMADTTGNYRIDHVPAGNHGIKAQMMGLSSAKASVRVAADDTLRADFVLHNWNVLPPTRPSRESSICAEHGTRMRWALIPIAYGLTVVNPMGRKDNSWNGELGGCMVRPDAASWGESCAECAARLNQRWSKDRWRGLQVSAPADWVAYSAPGVLKFLAPQGLAFSTALDTCGTNGSWRGASLNIDIHRGWANIRNDYTVWDVVGDCRATINVSSTSDTTRLVAKFSATPNSGYERSISVTASGRNAEETARAVLASVRFDPRGN
jgi:CarboxypepD_reg-like domain